MLLSVTETKPQARIVNSALQRADCESSGSSTFCNVSLPVSGSAISVLSALTANRLRGRADTSALEWPDLTDSLDTSPVMAAFDAAGTVGHIVLVIGYARDDQERLVLVNDPRSQPPHSSWKSHSELKRGLGLGVGLWSNSIHTISHA